MIKEFFEGLTKFVETLADLTLFQLIKLISLISVLGMAVSAVMNNHEAAHICALPLSALSVWIVLSIVFPDRFRLK